MAVRIGVNGFGRIGRLFTREALSREDLEVVGVNDLTSPETLAHLFKHDSVHGKFDGEVYTRGDHLFVNEHKIRVFSEPEPRKIPWGDLGVEFVLESTGFFRTRDKAKLHLRDSVKRVVISAPSKDPDITVVMGVNQDKIKEEHKIISNASCTTNCLGPLVKVLNDEFGLIEGYMTTVHAYTGDQKILDAPHKDLRRARAAATSIILTTTGAAKAIGQVIPELQGKLDGVALRVPVNDGSIVDLNAKLKVEVTADDINKAMKEASETNLKGILEYSDEPLVSADIIDNPHSSIFDSLSTMVMGDFVKVFSWYDNEWGYSVRLVDLISYLSKQ